jgi:FAD:protein FMN transferase
MTDLPQIVRLSLHAMATRFELVLFGDDPVRLRAAGEQALQEIESLETQLSFYRNDSEITWINSQAAAGPVKIEPRLFQLFSRCAELNKKTCGAFDITVGPLMHAWGFADRKPQMPERDILESARRVVGMHNVELSEENCSIRFKRPAVQLDLGGYGKGYAIERAIGILRENGITSAMLHGGTSSVCAIGRPPMEAAWKIALSAPFTDSGEPSFIELNNDALSVSASHGNSFRLDGHTYGHVLDPRNGKPATRARAAAVTGPSPSDCEALSKALLVLGDMWLPEMSLILPEYRAWVT